jgi:predicted NBD/HSP70 family sugar kinase
MYLGIDIGGTKTLVARINTHGEIQERHKFLTPKFYPDFLLALTEGLKELSIVQYKATGVGVPSKVDRKNGIAVAFGNLDWLNIPLQADIEKIVGCPTVIENDANLAGLSEAMLLKDYRKVLYVTISTGIGTGFIVDQKIDASMADSEGGNMMLQHGSKLEIWEDFASGRAIVKRYGKKASEITDKTAWQAIAHNIAIGMIDLIALMQPDVIVLGGAVGGHFEKFREYLDNFLKEYENPLFTLPELKQAARPALAVLYGCYDIARQTYG